GLLPVAWASDGTIEAVEDPERDFVVGVQWHAECLAARPQEAAVFRALVEAARRRDGAEAPLRRVA
ncbi:MAG TPA: gamma-glutamyl-gamma-aminobutyrate hydrolase family protein, partial [Solirubrobacteraceae bacterium]|nr:gamma-glutamyl-gamma-aminobutyrate hydrolase family protein [Solirubrobacteraceae bacterium]